MKRREGNVATETKPERVIYDAASARDYLSKRGLSIGKNQLYELLSERKIQSTRFGRQFWISKRELDKVLGVEQ